MSPPHPMAVIFEQWLVPSTPPKHERDSILVAVVCIPLTLCDDLQVMVVSLVADVTASVFVVWD